MIEPMRLPPPPGLDPLADPIAVALVDEVAARGWAATSVAGVVARAGVDRAEFDRRFRDLEECGLRVLEAIAAHFERCVATAFNAGESWRPALRRAAWVAADWIDANPNQVRFGTVEVLEMRSEMARVRREEVFVYCGRMIDAGRTEAPDPEAVPASAAIVAIGSVMQLLAHRVQKGTEIDAHGTVRELIYATVRPYVGEQAARIELTLPRPDQLSS
jgi:AcrR family transcriptional regulator